MKDFKSRVNVCFGKNDVRCVAGKELDEEIAYKTGRAVVTLLRCKEFIVGHDMRVSSHKLRNAFIRGIVEQGADVIDVHAIDSPGLYFVSGFLKKPGGMITASHNPAEYNGIKLTRAGAIPIGDKTGLMKVKELVTNGEFKESNRKGKVRKRDLSKEYRKHVRSFANVKGVKGLKIVVDAGNGMGGKMVPIVYEGLKVKMTKLGFKLDGSLSQRILRI
jgi:phosphomannomutase